MKKSFSCFFSVVYSIIFAEAFFCYFYRSEQYTPNSALKMNNYGVRVNVPNARYEHRFRDRRIQFRINSQGMRSDRDFSLEKPENCFRVVVLGDSFAMGWDVNIEDMFLSQTEEKIKKAGKTVEFLNLSVQSYSNVEQLLILKRDTLKYHPDMVLLVWDEHALQENLNAAIVDETYLRGVKEKTFKQQKESFNGDEKKPFFKYLCSYNFFSSLLYKYACLFYSEYAWKFRNLKETVSSEKNAQLLTAKIINEMNGFCRLNHVVFIILEIPLCNTMTISCWLPRDYISRDIVVLDPSERLCRTGGKIRYMPGIDVDTGTGHLTPLGNSVVADCLTEYLLKILDEKEKGK